MKPVRSCREIRPLVEMAADRLLDDPLCTSERRALDEHLQDCLPCRTYLERQCCVSEALVAYSKVSAQVSVEERVMRAVRAQSVAATAPAPALSRAMLARLAACFGVAGIGTLILEALGIAGTAFLLFRNPKVSALAASLALSAGRLLATVTARTLDTLWTILSPLGRAFLALTKGLEPLSGYGIYAALVFLAALLLLTLFAVRWDARRPAPSAGALR